MEIKALFIDVDGTMTDGKIYMGENGESFKVFNIKDGLGIHDILLKRGITPVIITARESRIVLRRCTELGIREIYQGVRDKGQRLEGILTSHGWSRENVAYIGDDINDLSCMEYIKDGGGKTGCPRDAARDVRKLCDFVSDKNGGDGAVRDFIEWLVGFLED